MRGISGPEERATRLSETRNLKMGRSAHAYVRGSTAKFYERLEARGGKVPQGPSIWICGDCHVRNLGSLADLKGRVSVQIRDLDQTVIGNPAHDLIRLGLRSFGGARLGPARRHHGQNFGESHLGRYRLVAQQALEQL